VNKAACSELAEELDRFPRHFENCEDIDTGVNRSVRWIKEVVAKHVTMSILVSISFFRCEDHGLAIQDLGINSGTGY
jgi:hypothetical protein